MAGEVGGHSPVHVGTGATPAGFTYDVGVLAVPPGSPRRSLPRQPISYQQRDAPLEALSTPTAWLVVVVASAIVGAVVSRSSLLATVHFAVTLLALLGAAVFARRPDSLLMVTAYAGLCDVWWRAAGARAPWEGSKYALVIGFAAIVIRFVRKPHNLGRSVTLVLLLVPGAVVGASVLGLGEVRQYLVARLAGLVAIAAAVLACSNLRLGKREVRGLYLVVLSPIVSLATQATLATVEAKDLNFGTESNSTAAGGFGPNQVSSALCFGGLLCLLVVLQKGAGWRLRLLASATGVWIVGQAVLTFSRGGLFGLVLAAGAVGLVALTVSGQRIRVVVAAGLLLVVAVQVLSWAGAFTGGASEERLSSTDSTNRGEIASSDVRLFLEHPILGVGVGVSPFERDLALFAPPHTEYTRLLAEHGVFGIAVIGLIVAIAARAVRNAEGWYRMASVGVLVVALSQMVHSATRLGSIAVAFGLASLLEDSEPSSGRS